MSHLRKSKARERFTIRHQYLRGSYKKKGVGDKKEKNKKLATREIRGKAEVNSIIENKGRESLKMGQRDAAKSSNMAKMKTAKRI